LYYKASYELTTRTLDLFEIERRFFSEQGINWEIITENKLPKALIKNVDWMCEAKYLETRPGIDEELVGLVSESLYKNIYTDDGETSISKICLRSDKEFGLQGGTCMFILQYMLVNKKWSTNINVPIKESNPIKIFRFEEKLKYITR
jgi:hypothetical protein